MKIKELLAKPENWTKGTYARAKDNRHTFTSSEAAVSWCLEGAVRKCYGPEGSTKVYQIVKMIDAIVHDIPKWNDAPERTHAEVLELVTRLDI